MSAHKNIFFVGLDEKLDRDEVLEVLAEINPPEEIMECISDIPAQQLTYAHVPFADRKKYARQGYRDCSLERMLLAQMVNPGMPCSVALATRISSNGKVVNYDTCNKAAPRFRLVTLADAERCKECAVLMARVHEC